jgi:hypothetical protein
MFFVPNSILLILSKRSASKDAVRSCNQEPLRCSRRLIKRRPVSAKPRER